MKTVIAVQRQDGMIQQLEFEGVCTVANLQVHDEEPTPVAPPEPQTYDWKRVEQTPGLWRPVGSPSRDLRILTQANEPALAFYVGRKDRPATAGRYWNGRRFIPAPECVEDMRIVFDSGSIDEARKMLSDIDKHVDRYPETSQAEDVQMFNRCHDFIKARCGL